MSDMSQSQTGPVDLDYYARRPSAELDEVALQADYCTRSMISFWRFRELGGANHVSRKSSKSPGADGEDGGALTIGNRSGGGIHYVSDHPDVRILSLSFIFLLVIFESAANAYFFAQESEFGLFGGVFQAGAVSLANVATSYFIIGFWGLRHASMPVGSPVTFNRLFIKGFGVIAVLVGISLVLLVNLSAAHYRNILDLQALGLTFPEELQTRTWLRFFIDEEVCSAILSSEIGDTIGSAATNAMCRPFALHSLDAMVLFALGIAISALAAFEGRKADSAFPGLSDAARHFERAREDLQGALEDYYDSFDDIIETIESDRGEGGKLTPAERMSLRRAMDDTIAEYRALLTTADALLADEFDVDQKVVDLIRRGQKGAAS